ncbi:MAG TPA: chorismate synthase [Syntrophales bacterium]|nr:chorismate synthase [Syntrophales bacterium]
MAGNTFGSVFRVTTWGESHGQAIGAVVDGCPPAIPLAGDEIQRALDRRRPGTGTEGTSPRRETDEVEILSGVFEGRTTGTPISLLIRNRDADPTAYEKYRDVFRPGHGDYTYFRKYGLRDHRGGGRASGRETAARVAAGAVAAAVTRREGVEVLAWTATLGGIEARCGGVDRERIDADLLLCPDPEAARRMRERIAEARGTGDSLGGIVEIAVRGCPAGLGEPVFEKADAVLAGALMGIGAVKGVEIGDGFAAASLTGSQANDGMAPEGFLSNHAGGILGGITTGQEIRIRVACKPLPSVSLPQRTIDASGRSVEISVGGRHDVSVLPRVVPVCEAMVQIVLADFILRQKAVRG